ncbi:MAG TPA: hypothetical protein VF650_00225, partial [Allosphingosinicella sp.]
AERLVPLHQPAAGPPPRGELGEEKITSNNRRVMQRRKMRHLRFDDRRKGVFLAAFAGSCDLGAAAAAAGVGERTVYYHLQRDPAFAEAFQAALEEGYERLEAELLRQRLEAQERLRSAMEAAEAAGETLPVADEGVEFDRAMKLLARWERRGGRLGRREVAPVRRRGRTSDEAIELLDRRLDALGVGRERGGAG